MRLSIDTGGTFTDLVLEDGKHGPRLYKSPTTPDDPVRGILEVLSVAAADLGIGRQELLGRASALVHATTRATNAILTQTTARTAFLTTLGHPDILLFREGGRSDPFDFTQRYPQPYVPRSLTYEVPERVDWAGRVVRPLDEPATIELIRDLGARDVGAVAVCLLWSIANASHEQAIGRLLEAHLPKVPYTLSHQLNPTLREYRRASSTAIDASLKPVMDDYLTGLVERLGEAGFAGRVLAVTASGGVLDARAVAQAPIHTIGSGPAMAPVAGRRYAQLEAEATTAIVADAGGTSYDVSLVRRGVIPRTQETWLGPQFAGHMTGFPSVDIKSVGAGGGSIAWVDEGGLLHVGPQSAGADPGPACYGRGGTRPTVTDASLVLGYLHPDHFLGGRIALDADAARSSIEEHVGRPLGLGPREAAAAVLELATEHMIHAIEDITLNQGIDPRTAVLVGGGGAAGLNVVSIARRLGCPRVIIPDVAATLSAAGGLMSDLTTDYARVLTSASASFDFAAVNEVLEDLDARAAEFIAGPGAGSSEAIVEFTAEARYPHQVWELEVPLRVDRFNGAEDVEALRKDFNALHREVFAIDDPESPIEVITWRARVRCRLEQLEPSAGGAESSEGGAESRHVYFGEIGEVEVPVHAFARIEPGRSIDGPAIVESPVTTVVVNPGASVERTAAGSLSIVPWTSAAHDGAPTGIKEVTRG